MKTNRLILKYSIALLIIAVVLTAFVFGTQILRDNLQQVNVQAGEDVGGNIMRQFVAVAVMFLMGLLVLLPFKQRLGMTHVMLLAYLLGVVLFDLISLLLLSVSIYYSLATVLAVYGVLVVALYAVLLKKEKSVFSFSGEETVKLVFWSVVILAVGFVISQSRITILTYDSVQYNLLGKVYATEHYYADYATFQMSWLMPVFTLLSSAAVFFGFDIPYALQNMFTLSAAGLFGYLLFSEARSYSFTRKKAIWVSLLGALLLVTSFFYVFLGITQVTNIFAGIALTFLMVYMYRYSKQNKTIDLALSLLFMLTFCFTRVEGPLISAFILGYLAHQKLSSKPLCIYTLVVIGAVLLNYISFYAHAGLDFSSDFLSPERSALSVALLVAVAIYVVAKEKWFADKTKLLGRIYFVAVLLFAVGASALDITKLINNVRVTYLNMFAEGFWVTGWFGVILLACFAMFMTKKKNTFMEGFIPIYFLVMLTIFAFRTTYLHLNWSDSGNRLLMHIYPLIVFVLADNLMSVFKPKGIE